MHGQDEVAPDKSPEHEAEAMMGDPGPLPSKHASIDDRKSADLRRVSVDISDRGSLDGSRVSMVRIGRTKMPQGIGLDRSE